MSRLLWSSRKIERDRENVFSSLPVHCRQNGLHWTFFSAFMGPQSLSHTHTHGCSQLWMAQGEITHSITPSSHCTMLKKNSMYIHTHNINTQCDWPSVLRHSETLSSSLEALMSVNDAQGRNVTSFHQPSQEELWPGWHFVIFVKAALLTLHIGR